VVRSDGLVKIIELFIFFYLLIYEEEMSGVKPDFATVTDRLIAPIKDENMAFINIPGIDHYDPERGYPLPEPEDLLGGFSGDLVRSRVRDLKQLHSGSAFNHL
jgi:hypothetical protein